MGTTVALFFDGQRAMLLEDMLYWKHYSIKHFHRPIGIQNSLYIEDYNILVPETYIPTLF